MMADNASNGTPTAATDATVSKPLPVPRWLVRTIWMSHRALHRISGGQMLRPATPTQWGMLRLTTIGRRSGREREAIVGFIEDGPNLVTPAMNGWADPEPAWWLNLEGNPHARVALPDGSSREVTAHAAAGEERQRLWTRFLDLKSSAYTNESAALRSRETAIVILEPRN
jgi:deazaflavin-dependent oxidoreductase (nitroreductase family)